ncbi:hypothetical protein ACP70R_045804 [Stipagrostis hirtigluma subsp. patula]
MVEAGVEPPAPPAVSAVAARLAARGVRPRRVSAKRSWPPGCGRFPAPPPAPPPSTAAGDGEKAADKDGVGSRAEEAVAPAAVSPSARNGALHQLGQNNEEAAVVAPAPVSPVVPNGAMTQKEQIKEEEAAAPTAISPVLSNGVLPCVQAHPESERVGEDGDRGENGRAHPSGNAGVPSSDGQEGNCTVGLMVPAAAVIESCGIAGTNGSVQNDEVGAGLSAVKEEDGGESGELVRAEVAGDGNGREMINSAAVAELDGKEGGPQGGRSKRWLMSAVNPPPKRRAVSAIRRFPPGCGRASVTTEGSGDLAVSPVRKFPPGCGRVAVTTTGGGDEEGMLLQAAPVTNGKAIAVDAFATSPISRVPASPTFAVEASNEKLESNRMADEGSSKAHDRIQEPQVASDDVPTDFVGEKQDSDRPRSVVTKASPKHGIDENEKMMGKISPREGKQVAHAVKGDDAKSKLERKDTFRTPISNPIDAKTKGKRLDNDKVNVALLDNVEASAEGRMQSKTSSTKKEVVRSNINMKQDKFAHKLKGNRKGKVTLHKSTGESKLGKHAATNKNEESDDMDLVPEQIIVQALSAPDKCPWRQGRKSVVSASKSLASRKKLNGKDVAPRNQLLGKVASSELIKNEAIEDNEDSSSPEDDHNSRALVVYEEKDRHELCVTMPPSVPSGSHHGDHDLDARSKVRKLLQKFQGLCRKLMQVEEQHSRNIGRIDLEAVNAIKKDPTFTKPGPTVGNIPGVEVGDEFHFRVELSIVGLHRPYQAGIDTAKVNGVPVAISIVASGGYPDELSSSNELIYTGSGGKAVGKKEAEDQKLERGNLALKNCIDTKTPVRVIHGFKGQSRGEVAHSKGKQTSTFTYDGLYMVVDCWQEGPKGSMVFKYKLQRIPGQPELALHVVKETRKSKVREGLCLHDISEGSERIPICVINTIDDMRPAPFKYVTKVLYPSWYKKEPPTGCDCKTGCSDSIKCACAVRNGGELPFNFNGAIVEAKPLIYECGPSCRCPPTCHNRVSQHGVKIPLEIFKTSKTGWGVRSLSSISSGSFICEYTGELLQDKEAEKRENDEYLFDIGHNYNDEELWEGLKRIPGLQSSSSSSKAIEGFTIDAAECGNVGRFINHSCSPNLYAQHVLWDHDDLRMPHVMLFAIENIPPLQELTYHYNYAEGQVRDKNGEEKIKQCYCGSSDCSGRLY